MGAFSTYASRGTAGPVRFEEEYLLTSHNDVTEVRQSIRAWPRGPFRLVEYQPSVGLKYAKNPDWYVPNRPFLDGFNRTIIPDYSAGLAQFEAKNLDEEKAAIGRLNKAALDDVVYAPTGFFLSYTAWRKNVSGIAKGPLPFFWGVSKSA